MKLINQLIIISIFTTLVWSCNEEVCFNNATNKIVIKFYDADNVTIDSVNINSLKVMGVDSSLISDSTHVTAVNLSLNPRTEHTSIIFNTQYGIDTLVLSYKRQSRFLSEDCGTQVFFTDLTYSQNQGFESIEIINTTLITDSNEDIRIIF